MLKFTLSLFLMILGGLSPITAEDCSAQDKSTLENRASKAFDEAVKLQGQGSPSDLQGAIVKYEEAIKLWGKTPKSWSRRVP